METALYALTFIPIVIIVLTVHEAGHMWAAKALGIRTTGFQIGVGPTLLRMRTGRIRMVLPPGAPGPARGQDVHVWIERQTKRNEFEAAEWQPSLRPTLRWVWPTVSRRKKEIETPVQKASHPILNGRVRETGDGWFEITGHHWTLGAIPLMAMVHIAEDQSESMPGFFNTASWKARMTVILAGVAANMVLLLGVIAALAVWPAGNMNATVLAVREIDPGSPAEAAGLMPGDLIVQAGDTLLPDPEQLAKQIAGAVESGGAITILVQRRHRQTVKRITPDRATKRIGIAFEQKAIEASSTGVGKRFLNAGGIYLSSVADLFRTRNYGENPETSATPRFSGVITAAHYTAQVVRIARLKAWVAVLGAVTMSVALVNLVPIPPLDGFQMVLQTVRALRKNRPVNPLLERQLALYGLALIFTLVIYVAIKDVQRILW